MAKDRYYLPEGTLLKERFKIVKHLSSGRNSNLYIVEDRKKFDFWVIKELISSFNNPIEAKQAYQQFELQAKILNKLDQPQLPKVEDFFEENSRHFLVMEYLDGKNFKDLVESEEEFFSEEDIIGWAIQLCEVLSYLHGQKPHPIIFRDLKPENIILTKDKSVKLINFGISKLFDPHSRTLAVAKTITPHFSPIEQYAMVTDTRSDIYSMGATLYFISTKVLPVDAIDRSMNNVPLKFCREYNKSISLELEGIILKAMELDKEDRYQSAEEMMNVLKEIQATVRTSEMTDQFSGASSSIQTIDPDAIQALSKKTIVMPTEDIDTRPVSSKAETKTAQVSESEEIQSVEKDSTSKKKKVKKVKKKQKKEEKKPLSTRFILIGIFFLVIVIFIVLKFIFKL
ncbi:MAG TPA: serine/threonine-protein kinase [Candidatus Eremiobacteraeota bacterium]|nr:MAG: Serine/threonine-protein kinase PrkC [bacterium ADurb.Bin363]HPZ09742.1 serine/threonine-protein kinase [Candidatus Eremiobacteraeota bacterium]